MGIPAAWANQRKIVPVEDIYTLLASITRRRQPIELIRVKERRTTINLQNKRSALLGTVRQHQIRTARGKEVYHMSVKIKVSYSTDQELAGVIRLLSPKLKSWKKSKKQEGRYKNAYAMLELGRKPEGTREEKQSDSEQ